MYSVENIAVRFAKNTDRDYKVYLIINDLYMCYIYNFRKSSNYIISVIDLRKKYHYYTVVYQHFACL